MTKTSKFRPYLAAAIINITSLCLGVSIGWMSPAAPSLQSEHPPIGGDSPLSDETISWLGSLQFVGGIAGVTFWGQITERFGRKPAGYLISIPLIIGWNTVLWAPSDIWLMIGRFVLGLSGTGALILTPAYVSEVAEDSYRGALGSFIILSFNLGVVAAYFVGSIFSLKILTIFCGSIPIVFVCLFYFLPESPVYLWTKGKKTEAYESLLWYRSGNNTLVERELSILDSVVSSNKSVPISRLYDSKGTIKAMIISLALFAFQQFCGILMLLTYTSIILQKSQIEFSPHTASVVIGLVQLTSSWATSFIIDRIDRRILLIVSNLFMSVALFVIGLFFYLKDNSENNILPNWVPFIAICLHVIVYCASAPMPYIITTEILRPEVLPLAFSVTVFWGTIISFSSVKIYIILVEYFQMSGNFWFFAIWCIIAIVFTVFLIPETRGKPLLQVLKELEGEKFTRRNTKNVYEACESEIPIRDYPTKTILVDNNKNP